MLSPSCVAGTLSSSAVRGTAGGPSTVTEGELDSRRPSSVQTESPWPHVSVPPLTLTVTASPEEGSAVTFHSALLPPTRCALRTAPLVAVIA